MDHNLLSCLRDTNIDEDTKLFISTRLRCIGVNNNFKPVHDLCQGVVWLFTNTSSDLPHHGWDKFISIINDLGTPLVQGMIESTRAGRGQGGLSLSAYPICALILDPFYRGDSLNALLAAYLIRKLICLTVTNNSALSAESLNNIATQLRLAINTNYDQHEVFVWLSKQIGDKKDITNSKLQNITPTGNNTWKQKQKICWQYISRLINTDLSSGINPEIKSNRHWLYILREPTAYDWWAPKQEDLRILSNYVQSDNPKDHSTLIKRLLVGLAMSVHILIEDYDGLFISQDGPITPDGIFIKNIYLENTGKLLPSIKLDLPPPVRGLIQQLCKRHTTYPISLADLLEIESSQIRNLMKDGISDAFNTINHRISPERLTHTLRHELALAYQDPALIYYLTGLDGEMHPTLASYIAYRSNDLQNQYRQVTQKIFGLGNTEKKAGIKNSDVYFLGAGMHPDFTMLKKQVYQFRNEVWAVLSRVGEKSSLEELYHAHNLLTTYITLFLYFATGHRPINDPIEQHEQIDLGNGLLLIQDKVVSEAHQYRVVPIPDALLNQLKNYLNYLGGLWHLLAARNVSSTVLDAVSMKWLSYSQNLNKNLSKISAAMAGGHSLFFIFDKKGNLTKVTSSQLEMVLPSYLEYGVSGARRHLATYLYRHGYSATDITIILGHSAADLPAFGATSTLVPAHTFEKLLTGLNQLIEHEGWSVLPVPDYFKFGPPKLPVAREITQPLKESERRKDHREWQRQQSIEAVNNILSPYEPADFTDPTIVSTVQSEIIHTLRQDRLNVQAGLDYYIKCLHRYIVSGHKINLPEILHWSADPCPFDKNSISLYQQARLLQANLLDAWKQETAVKIANKRIAEICLAATLFGALVNRDYLEALPKALLNNTWKIANNLFIEFHENTEGNQSLSWRWWPDDISKALIIGLVSLLESTKLPVSRNNEASVKIEIRKLLDKHGPGIKLQGDLYSCIASLGAAYWTFHLPGTLRSVATGEESMTPLPQATWIRLLIPGNHAKPTDNDKTGQPKSFLPARIISQGVSQKPSFSRFYKYLLKLFSEIAGQSFTADNSDTKRREALAERTVNVLKTQDIPVNGQYILGWAIELALDGTRFGDVVFSTVQTYVMKVARQLRDFAPDDDILKFDDEDYSRLLNKIINGNLQNDINNLSDVLGRMIEFLYYLSREYDAFIPNLAPYLGLGKSRSNVDANLISFPEYHDTLTVLYHDARLNREECLLYALLLFLGYRLGVRISEALGLRERELIIHKQLLLHAIVKTNVSGRRKTPACNRYTPLLGDLTDLEKDLLNRYLTEGIFVHVNDDQGFIFRSRHSPRVTIDQHQALNHIHGVLRQVCGDQSIRFHHCRHTKASLDACLLVAQGLQQGICHLKPPDLFQGRLDPAALGIALTGKSVAGATTLSALARIMGHSRIHHTYANYLHLADWQIRTFIKHPQLVDSQIGYFLYMKANTICQMRRERKIPHPECHRVIDEYLKKSSIQTPETVPIPALIPHTQTAGTPLTLLNIENCLLLISKHPSGLDTIIHPGMAGQEDLLNMVYSAAALERETGYTGYRLGHLSRQDIPAFARKVPPPRVDQPEDRRIANKLVELQGNLERNEAEFNHRATLLSQAFRKGYMDGHLQFVTPGELAACLKSTVLLGLKNSDFSVAYPEQASPQYIDWVRHELKEQLGPHMPELVAAAAPKTDSGKPWEYLRLRLNPRCGKGISYTCTLYRLLFIISVYARKNIDLPDTQNID